jgi:hypothetical protein
VAKRRSRRRARGWERGLAARGAREGSAAGMEEGWVTGGSGVGGKYVRIAGAGGFVEGMR